MLVTIDHIHVIARDIEQSIDFYTKTLGFDFLRQVEFGPADSRRQVAFVRLGEVLLELIPPGDVLGHVGIGPDWAGYKPFALTVEDMQGTIEELRGRSVAIDTEPRDSFSFNGITAAIVDPSGNVLELREWSPVDSIRNPSWQPTWPDVVRIR